MDRGGAAGQEFANDALYFLWQIYLDNFDALDITSESDLRRWIRTTSRFATDMRKVYEEYGVQRSEGKTVERESWAVSFSALSCSGAGGCVAQPRLLFRSYSSRCIR